MCAFELHGVRNATTPHKSPQDVHHEHCTEQKQNTLQKFKIYVSIPVSTDGTRFEKNACVICTCFNRLFGCILELFQSYNYSVNLS